MSPEITLPAATLKLGLYQFAPVLRDVEGNARRIVAAAQKSQSDLLVTPELSLTGYDLRDDVHATAVLPSQLAGYFDRPVLAGYVEKSEDFIPYNATALFREGRADFRHRKVYLPTYGIFDEGRYFGRGKTVDVVSFNNWKLGLLICEDMWHPMLAYLQAMQGAHALIVMSAAPERGAGMGSWHQIAVSYARLYGIYVVVCNRGGPENDLTFAGRSFVVAPNTEIIAEAGPDEELLSIELQAEAVRASRIPYAHLRDEDAALAISELSRIHGSSSR
jgi:predicted amidohydrolase